MDQVLAAVGPRLRRIRTQRQRTLADLSAATGISISTLSRLESGQRKPSLELLLPIAKAHQVPLDELVGAPPVGDPRVRPRPIRRDDSTILPLTHQPGGLQAYKMIVDRVRSRPEPRTHEGYEGLYVLSGRLRLVLADHDIVLSAGEAAEIVSAERSSGGHRRYSRRMLVRATRARELFDEGHNLAATRRIVDLEDQLGAARDEITGLRHQLRRPDGHAHPAG